MRPLEGGLEAMDEIEDLCMPGAGLSGVEGGAMLGSSDTESLARPLSAAAEAALKRFELRRSVSWHQAHKLTVYPR